MASEPGGGAALRNQRATFILRLWREGGARSAWRGQLELVQRGDRVAVSSLDGAVERIRGWLEMMDDPVPSARCEGGSS